MSSLRGLLLDCGTALRRADPDFESTPLRVRLEEAILALGKASESPEAHLGVRRELDELRQALADAVPGVNDNIPPAEAARLRMRMLIDAGARIRALPTPVHQTPAEPADVQPTRAALQDVAAGSRMLTREEREWCLSEAMVLSGFRKTPVQLIECGEPELAKMILAGSPLD